MATTQAERRAEEQALRDVDWQAVERTPEFQELVASRRRFVAPATVFFLAWYLGFIALAGYAPELMSESVYEGLTVGYCLALTQFVMVGILGVWYLRRSQRTFDPLSQKVADMVADRGERFARETPPTTPLTATAPSRGDPEPRA